MLNGRFVILSEAKDLARKAEEILRFAQNDNRSDYLLRLLGTPRCGGGLGVRGHVRYDNASDR